MPDRSDKVTRGLARARRARRVGAPLASALALLLVAGGGCFSGDEGGQFYGRVAVPRAQEFRWSDGGLPRVFDPARAAAPPDTDAVRALYDGLTDYDPRTLAPVSADAERWESSKDARVWTFYLRGDARWSNGDPVTAEDYARSWRRTLKLGEDAPHVELFSNLTEAAAPSRAPGEPRNSSASNNAAQSPGPHAVDVNNADASLAREAESARRETTRLAASGATRLAVDVLDAHTLRVRLRRPDPSLPSLLAHTIFRPVYASASDEKGALAESPARASTSGASVAGATGATDAPLVTNGAFRLSEKTEDGVLLERAPGYRDASSVVLDKVRFVNERDAESALRAYRAGEIDAVTNANLGPAAVKLLASYQDFERNTFGAITYYDFNPARPPFDDVRVRAAFALAVDRKRLSEDTLGGSTVPAEKFLPPQTAADADAQSTGGQSTDGAARDDEKRPEDKRAEDKRGEGEVSQVFTYDPQRARRLLAEAGYPGGQGFPRVRLLVNRNDQHSKVAEAVAEMWRTSLGVETEIEAKGWDEYETKLRAGEYDVAKRSLIMQTPDEEQSVAAMFPPDRFTFGVGESPVATASASRATRQAAAGAGRERNADKSPPSLAPELLTEADALNDVPAIPIYFASAFSLVKPYVLGFDANLLGVYSLKGVRIETGWQPPAKEQGRVVATGR